MPKLPKFDILGQAHFATTKTNRFLPLFLTHDMCKILINNIAFYRSKHDFRLLGYVIMPDHIHLLIYPQAKVPIQKILQDIKRYSAKQILERLLENPTSWDELGGLVIPPERLKMDNRAETRRCLQNVHVTTFTDFQVIKPRTKGQEHQIWQESFYDFNIYSDAKLHEKLNYMHKNPLAWNLVEDPGDYFYSSYRNYYDDGGGNLPIQLDHL